MQTTPLYSIYEKYGAKIVDFHGWALPVQFAGIIREHLAVREKAGIFDVSHMGEFLVAGPDAAAFLDYVLTNSIADLMPGSVRYSPMCLETGGTIDDLLVYRLSADRFWLVVNASNIQRDLAWIRQCGSVYQAEITDLSGRTAQIAVQGPKAAAIITKLAGDAPATLKYYQFLPEVKFGRITALLSRTGYTGEDGFELYCSPGEAAPLWEELIGAGEEAGMEPVGLGARDTLRFEAALPLYGNELSEVISPLEAGLARFVKFEKENFIGKKALLAQTNRLPRRLVGLAMTDRGIPRSGFEVFKGETLTGSVTSGNFCPYLNNNLAMALIRSEDAGIGQSVAVGIRGKRIAARVVALPFYSRKKGAGR